MPQHVTDKVRRHATRGKDLPCVRRRSRGVTRGTPARRHAAAYDLAAAPVAHEALRRLLSEPGAPVAVVNLNAERERRR